MNWKNVKILGRYWILPDALWLSSSASEISFRFRAKSGVTIRLLGDESAGVQEDERAWARYETYLNGKSLGQGRMDSPRKTVFVNAGEGEIRFVKLSESQDSSLGVECVELDGEIEPLPEKRLKIEFVGDSITCGYGVEGSLDESYTTATENAEKAYACLTAKALDADACLVSFSGFGILSGYTGDGAINTESLLPPYYDRVGVCGRALANGARVQDESWDFSCFVPDAVVVNLGTNDMSYCLDDGEKKQTFRRKYAAFLKTVRRAHPGARILCALGAMGTSLCPYMERAVADFIAETGDTRVRALALNDQRAEDSYGTDYHPSEKTHRMIAETVTEALRAWMKE